MRLNELFRHGGLTSLRLSMCGSPLYNANKSWWFLHITSIEESTFGTLKGSKLTSRSNSYHVGSNVLSVIVAQQLIQLDRAHLYKQTSRRKLADNSYQRKEETRLEHAPEILANALDCCRYRSRWHYELVELASMNAQCLRMTIEVDFQERKA